MITLSETPHAVEPETTTRVALMVMDARRLVADALVLALGRYNRLEVLPLARNLSEGVAKIRSLQPELVLVSGDLFQSGFRTLQNEVSVRLRQVQLAVFADELSDRQLQIALDMEVAGVLSQQDSLEKLANYLHAAGSGETVISPAIRPRLEDDAEHASYQVIGRHQLGQISNRQLEVIQCLASGLTVRESAERMHLSEKAVESHKFRVMKNLGLRNRVDLCRWAIREGLVSP